MKKILTGLLVIILSSVVFLLGFNTKKNIEPNYLYQVYLDDQVLGVIKSKSELEEYIDKQGASIKEKYNVDKVYAPDGLEIRKIITYADKLDTVESVYDKLSDKKSFTIHGYQFTIKKTKEDENGDTVNDNEIIYVTDENIFKDAVVNTIETFIGEENYNSYLNGTQEEIKETGTIYNDVYVDEDITKKEVYIPVSENIYTDVEKLSQYVLFSTNDEPKKYTVKAGDTIESVANNNKISVQEFLTSNPEFTSKDNVLYTGQVVSVAYANPIVDVMTDLTVTKDQTSYFTVQEQKSSDIIAGNDQVIQNGENGLDRVTQNLKYKNGVVVENIVTGQVQLKPSIPKIVLVGTKYVSGVAGGYWSWPTSSYTISSGFGGRWFSGSYSFHTGLDIFNYYGAPVYAANNGVVTMAGWYGTYGIFVGINHNNGLGTGYGHMSYIAPGIHEGSVVERGQIIGYIGMTGQTTGPHVHFEVYYGSKHPGYNYSSFFNPQVLY